MRGNEEVALGPRLDGRIVPFLAIICRCQALLGLGHDGLNEFFQIEGIEDYPNNNVKIFNRWGVLVYETDGYGGANVFRGISDGRATVQRGKELPTGTYYYILTFPAENPGQSSYTGYLYINR